MAKKNVVAIVKTFMYLPRRSEGPMRDRKIELNLSIVVMFMFVSVMWYRVVCLIFGSCK